MRLRQLLRVGAVLLTAGCGGDPTGPAALPRLGRYDYAMAVPVNLTSPNLRTFTGTLVVTYISRDSLAGYWDVPASTYYNGSAGRGYQTRLSLGFFNGGGWYFLAYPTDGGTIQHRLYPGAAPHCEGARLFTDGGGITRRDGVCTVRYIGP